MQDVVAIFARILLQGRAYTAERNAVQRQRVIRRGFATSSLFTLYLRYTSSTSSDVTLVTIKMEVGLIMMTMNVTRVIDNLA